MHQTAVALYSGFRASSYQKKINTKRRSTIGYTI